MSEAAQRSLVVAAEPRTSAKNSRAGHVYRTAQLRNRRRRRRRRGYAAVTSGTVTRARRRDTRVALPTEFMTSSVRGQIFSRRFAPRTLARGEFRASLPFKSGRISRRVYHVASGPRARPIAAAVFSGFRNYECSGGKAQLLLEHAAKICDCLFSILFYVVYKEIV